jgi:hypothetical protein
VQRVNDLGRRLKTLRRPLLMLETLLRSEWQDEGLLADIEKPGGGGMASHQRDATRRTVHRYRAPVCNCATLQNG